MNQDSVALLQDCNSGAKTAVQSFREVMDHVENPELRRLLTQSMEVHESIGNDAKVMLHDEGEPGRDPSMMARAATWLKINAELLAKNDDRTVADLITDGCNMGIKQLSVSFNKYPDATPDVKQLADRIRAEEDELLQKLRLYL
ncbi:MAG: hypothetical protein IKN72_01015 [Clostridia bacterium]|nr:hypothetical protein [Clostridia bacterium]MBR3551951.1 hypothetical protein [Clostridia bacterium]